MANGGVVLCNELGIHVDYMGVLEGATPAKYGVLAPPGCMFLTTKHVYQLFRKQRKDLTMPEPCIVLEDTYTPKSGQATIKNHGWVWERGCVYVCGATGGFLVQCAVNFGATEVHVVGCEGYRSNSQQIVPDTFDGAPGLCSGESMTLTLYGPAMTAVVRASPNVRFVFYGDVSYDVAGAEVVPCGATTR